MLFKMVLQEVEMKLVVAVLLSLSLTSPALAKNCTKGKPCGKSCIAVHKTCRK